MVLVKLPTSVTTITRLSIGSWSNLVDIIDNVTTSIRIVSAEEPGKIASSISVDKTKSIAMVEKIPDELVGDVFHH